MQLLREEIDLEGEELDKIMETLFPIFYLDNIHSVEGPHLHAAGDRRPRHIFRTCWS